MGFSEQVTLASSLFAVYRPHRQSVHFSVSDSSLLAPSDFSTLANLRTMTTRENDTRRVKQRKKQRKGVVSLLR